MLYYIILSLFLIFYRNERMNNYICRETASNWTLFSVNYYFCCCCWCPMTTHLVKNITNTDKWKVETTTSKRSNKHILAAHMWMYMHVYMLCQLMWMNESNEWGLKLSEILMHIQSHLTLSNVSRHIDIWNVLNCIQPYFSSSSHI